MSYGALLASGKPLPPKRSGVVVDIDRRLPATLDALNYGERVPRHSTPGHGRGWTGRWRSLVGADERLLKRVIHPAVELRVSESPESPVPVFDDVLDVARRALATGSQANLRSAAQVVVADLLGRPARARTPTGVPMRAETVAVSTSST